MENNFSSVWHNGDAARQSGGPTFMIKKPGASIATEHAGEPPLRWGEYPNDMEINTQQSLEYDENRARFRGVRVDQDFIAERQQQPEGSQITDPVWIQASKNLYKFMHPTKSTPPTTYDVGPMSNLERERIRPEEGQPDADFTNEDYANWGVEFMSRFNYNITAMVFDAIRIQNAPPEMAKSMYYLVETADRDGITGRNFARGFSNFMSDPATYVGLGTFGIGLVGKNAGQQLGKMAFKELLKKTVLAMPTKASLAVGAEGAVFAAADDLARQSINIKADQQEGVDVGQTALAAGTGAVLGDRLSAGAPAAIEAITRGVKGVPEVLDAIGDELTSGAMYSNPLGMVADAVSTTTKSEPTLNEVLDVMAEQMKLAPKDRVQPSTGNSIFDLTPQSYEEVKFEQKETPVPRAPEGKKLPLNNRGAAVIDMADKISDVLAARARPYIGNNVQYFYHTGPLISKAVALGIPEAEAREQLKKFALNYAATSPRTQTEPNLKNASLVSAKQKAGIDVREIVGPGGEGINEKGYPMIINEGGLHLKLIGDAAGDGIDSNVNPKPATFAENVSGNLAGVTVDTHAIRAVFDAMNELQPGSIPIEFIGGKNAAITKEKQAMYLADPASFNAANMVKDTLASQKIGGVSMQTEYAIFSDIYKMVAEKIGVQPAEAQSLSWFANGDKTGLGSAPKTIVELIDERIDVTAQLLGQNKDDVFKKFMQGSIPLLSIGGGMSLLETGQMQEGEEL